MLEDDTFFITEVRLSDSGLQRVAGALASYGGAGTPPGQRGWLRSWVTGWTHRLEVDTRGLPQAEPIAGVGRLAEAVVDVLLERRPLEQMRRWLSRDVVGQLTAPGAAGAMGGAGAAGTGAAGSGAAGTGAGAAGGARGVGGMGGVGGVGGIGTGGAGSPGGAGAGGASGAGTMAVSGAGAGAAGAGERRTPRFASRSMIRSVRLHQPAAGIVESTVVVQDGTRVRAVALRFEQAAPVGQQGRQTRPVGFDWLCTALQFN